MVPIGRDQAINALKSTGSSDPDVLYARKEELLSGTRVLKLLATTQIVAGGAMSLSIIGAIVGVPAILRGLATRRRIAESVSAVEAAYTEYVNQTAAKRSTVIREGES